MTITRSVVFNPSGQVTSYPSYGFEYDGGVSAEVASVLIRFTGITDQERFAAIRFVNTLVLAGIWSKLDAWQMYTLKNGQGLVDWINGPDSSPTTATLTGATLPLHEEGYYFPTTTSYIATGIDLSSATNYVLDDCSAWVRVGFMDASHGQGNPTLFGSIDGSSRGLRLRFRGATPAIQANVNSTATSEIERDGMGYLDNTLYGVGRSDSNSTFITEGPVTTVDLGVNSTAVSPAEIFVNGNRNNSGGLTGGSRYWTCQLFAAGAYLTAAESLTLNNAVIQFLVDTELEVSDEVRIPLMNLTPYSAFSGESVSATRVIVRKDSEEVVSNETLVGSPADTIWTTEAGWITPDGSNYIDLTSVANIRDVTRSAADKVTVMSCHIKSSTTTHAAASKYGVFSYDETASDKSGWRMELSNSGAGGANKFWQLVQRLKGASGNSFIADNYIKDRNSDDQDTTDVLCFVVHDWDAGERTIISSQRVLSTCKANFDLYKDGTIPETGDELGIVLFAELQSGPTYVEIVNDHANTQYAIRDVRIATISKPADQIIDRLLRRYSGFIAARGGYEL